MHTSLAGRQFELRHSGTLWWPAQKILLVSDLHLGKALSFQAHGIPLPATADAEDLARLAGEVGETQAQQLWILGDFLHDRTALTSPELLSAFFRFRRDLTDCEVHLIVGNHDRGLQERLGQWGFASIQAGARIAGVHLQHQPNASARPESSLAGHIHPVYKMGNKHDRLRLRCFWQRQAERCLVLPAFGSMTGGYPIEPQAGDKVFVLAERKVVEISV